MEERRFDFPNITFLGNMESPLINTIPYRAPADCRAWVDLRGFADDRTVLSNPHKGWFWHYVDNGFSRPAYREEHDPEDHLTDFPGLNHLYLRFDWGDVEREEGHPDWSRIDRIMDEWGRYGYRFSLRICAYEGAKEIPFATPEYVYRAGARGYDLGDGRLEPDYGDSVFLDKLGAFLARAGERFNGDPRVELIDVGSYGTWGEGHTGYGSQRIYPAEVVRKHFDLHLASFPDVPLLINDDHINSGWSRGEVESVELLRYARTLGFGLQDDSVCVRSYAIANGYTTLRTPWMFDLFWENAPIVLEFEHYHMVSQEHFRQGLPFLEAMRATHCTFAGFHGYPRPWLQRERWFTEYCANRLGYWYFLNGYELPFVKSNAVSQLRLQFENRGFGLCYRPYALKVELRGENGRFEQRFDAGNRSWRPGESVDVALPLRAKNVKPGAYGLYVGLFEGDVPIRLALRGELAEGGMYHIGNVEVLE